MTSRHLIILLALASGCAGTQGGSGDADTDSDTDTDSGTDSGSDADSDSDSDADSDSDSDADSDSDTESDSGTVTDTDTDSGTDTGTSSDADCAAYCGHEIECDPDADEESCLFGCDCGAAIWRADFWTPAVACLATLDCDLLLADDDESCAVEGAEGLDRTEAGLALQDACETRRVDCPDEITSCSAWGYFEDDVNAELDPCFDEVDCVDLADCISGVLLGRCEF